MLDTPNSALNEEERALLNTAPEECLRYAVRRGALPLDQIVERPSPRVAAVVRSIATGERLPELSEHKEPSQSLPAGRRGDLSAYPQLQHIVDEEVLTLAEAIQAAHAIDHALGRYMTGTKYAAP